MKWFEKTRAWVMKNFPSSEINENSSEAEVVNFLEENDAPSETTTVELSEEVTTHINESIQTLMASNIAEAVTTHMSDNPIESLTEETVSGLITAAIKPVNESVSTLTTTVEKNRKDGLQAINDAKLNKKPSASSGAIDPPAKKPDASESDEDSTTISMNDLFSAGGGVVEL